MSRRVILPVWSGVNLLPNARTPVGARSQLDDFYPDRILIKDADRWIVDSVSIDGRPQIAPRGRDGLPGAMFSPTERVPPLMFDRVPPGGELLVEARYVGPRLAGEPLQCCVFGSTTPESSMKDEYDFSRARKGLFYRGEATVAQAPPRILRFDASSGTPSRRRTGLRLPPRPRSDGFWPERLAIRGAADWVVNDVVLNGASLMTQAGDLPGAMFGDDARLLHMGYLAPDDDFFVAATYVGRGDGAVLAYALSGPAASSDCSAVDRVLLPMSSGVNILPDSTATIASRPRDRIPAGHGFRARRIVIADPHDWVVNLILVGNNAQFASAGDVPGVAFAAGATGNLVRFDPVRLGLNFTICATYVGESNSGAPFVCGVSGDVRVVVDVVDLSAKRLSVN